MPLFIVTDEVSLSASGSDSLVFDVSRGERVTINRMGFVSTGNFKITEIKDTASGYRFLSGSIYNDQLKQNNGNVFDFPIPITLEGPTKLVIEVTDTSGSSNNVRVALYGSKE